MLMKKREELFSLYKEGISSKDKQGSFERLLYAFTKVFLEEQK